MSTTAPSSFASRAVFAGLLLLIAALPLAAQGAAGLIAKGRMARDEGRLDAAAELFRRAAAAAPENPEPLLLLAETLAWQKRFDESETIYRGAIERYGPSRAARIGLARVLLWTARYREAARILATLLEENRNDVDAREELARAHYWSGDFRTAARHFERVVALDPSRSDSARSLAEIRSVASPSWTVRAASRSDDQPYHLGSQDVEIALFSDPLTQWSITAGAWQMDEPGESAAHAGVTTAIGLPSLRLTVVPSARLVSFPDGETEVLGGLRVTRKVAINASLSLVATRNALLLNRHAASTHPWVTDVFAAYELSVPDGPLARVRAGSSHFFDGNDGEFADAYVLAPILRRRHLTLAAGIAGAYRDTADGRFRVDDAVVTPAPPGTFSYGWRGVYDPYWTPHDLRELRGIASIGSGTDARIFWTVQVSGGRARDVATAFGPRSGTSPSPPEPFAVTYTRGYAPWDLIATVELPAGGTTRLRIDYEHTRTIYYEADELRATLVGRF
jgi:Flp pilus assembly protein TadD